MACVEHDYRDSVILVTFDLVPHITQLLTLHF